jgi:hypothetical protein
MLLPSSSLDGGSRFTWNIGTYPPLISFILQIKVAKSFKMWSLSAKGHHVTFQMLESLSSLSWESQILTCFICFNLLFSFPVNFKKCKPCFSHFNLLVACLLKIQSVKSASFHLMEQQLDRSNGAVLLTEEYVWLPQAVLQPRNNFGNYHSLWMHNISYTHR